MTEKVTASRGTIISRVTAASKTTFTDPRVRGVFFMIAVSLALLLPATSRIVYAINSPGREAWALTYYVGEQILWVLLPSVIVFGTFRRSAAFLCILTLISFAVSSGIEVWKFSWRVQLMIFRDYTIHVHHTWPEIALYHSLGMIATVVGAALLADRHREKGASRQGSG